MPKIKYKDLARALRQDLGQDVANIDDVSLVQAWITDNPQYKNDVIFDGQVGRIAKRTGNLLEDLKTAEPLPRTAVAPQRGRSGFEAPMSTPFTGGFVGGEMAAPQRPAEDIEFLPTTYSNTLEGQRILDFTKGKKDVESIRDYFTSVAQEGAVGSESKLAKTAALRNALDVNLRFAEEQYNDLYPDAPLSWSDFMAKSSDPQLQQDREILGQELTSLFGKMKYYEAMGDEQSYNQAKQSADEIANQYDSLFGEFEQALQVASPLLEQVNQYGQELNQLNEEANKEAQDIEETSFFGKAALSLSRFGAGLGYVAADLFSTLGATGIGDKMKSGLMDSQLSTKDPRMAAFKAPYDSKKGGFTGGVGNAVGFIFEQGLNMIPAIAAFSTPYGRAAQTALATIGTTATTYDEYANEIDRAAIETGAKIDPQTRAALAGMASLKTGLIENVIPINKFIKLGMAKSFADDAVRALASGKSLEVAMRGAYQASKAFAAAQGVEISEEIIDQLAQETINESVRSQMAGLEQSDQFAARPAEFSDYKDIVVNTAIAVAPLAGVGFISNGARFKEDLYHHVGRKGDLDAVMDLFEENRDKFKGESYKKNTDRLKKVSSVYESIPQEFDDINARKVADNMLEIDRLDGQINNRTSSSQREAAEKKIANLQGEIDQIYREEQEKVAPAIPQAVTEEVPAELESQMPESDQNVLNVVSERIEPILNPLTQQMTNAEEIDMAEIEAVAEQMIDEQARILESENLSEEEKQSISQLIELQIDNILSYEFATITTTEQDGEKTKTAGLVATPREGRPLPESVVSRDRFDGAGVRIGGRGAGRITVKRLPGFGGRSVYGVSFGNRKGVAPVEDLEFDNLEFVAPEVLGDGSLNVRVRDSKSGLEFTITDPELSIDLAIAAQLKEAGRKEFPQPAFLEAVREVTQGQPTQVTTFPNLGRTGTTPAAVGVEPQTEQDVRQETNAPQEGRGQGEDAAPVPQEEGRQEGQVTPLDVAQEGETPPAAKRTRKTEQQKADESKAAAEELKKTLGVLQAGKKKPLFQRPGQKTEIDEDTQIEVASEEAGISPKNFRDLYRVNRELFGLNQSEAMSAAIAMDKMTNVMAKRAGVSKTEMYGRLNFKKATEQDLPQSAIKQDKEEILRVFHGTSKDKDFKKFKDTGKGVFVTISPKEASEYAEQNDSMTFGDYDPRTRKFKEINTASRVIPMNLKLGNSYKLTESDLEFLNSKPNYSALQKELHARIKADGFDTIDYGNGVYAVLTEGRLRSMLTNEVLFQKDLPQGVKFQEDAVKARGAMMITLDGQATIYALTDPNVSTPLHELAHVFEHYLTDEERTTVQDWAKTKGWTIKTSEAFARGFEKYLSEGQAPTPALQKIFDNFKQWLTDIYRGIVGSDIDIELNKPMRDLYAKMFDQAAPTQQQAQPEAQVSVDGTAKERRDKFFDEIEGMYRAFPFQPGFIISEKPNKNTPLKDVKILGRLSVYEGSNDGSLYIDEVQAQNFGERTGNGSKIMQIVSDMADKYGLTIELVASPISGNNMTGAGKAIAKALNTPEKLAKFYEKFGFVNVADNLGREEYSRITKELRSAGFSTVNPIIPPSRQLLMVRPPKAQQQAQPEAQVESTAKALEGVDTQPLKRQLGIEANWDMIGEGDFLSGLDPILAYTQRQLPDWNRESQRGNINPNSEITYDIVRGNYGGIDRKGIVQAKDENGVVIGVVELDAKSGIDHIAVAPEFRGKGVSDKLIQTLKENNPQLDLSKTKLRSKGFEKAFGNKIIAEAYHKAKADGSNPELVQAVEDLLGKTTPEAKPEKTISEQRKEFRETAKKYFEGMKKMGVIFDAERNAAEDKAFIKALTDYIKLEIDNGMVTFKGFIDKASALTEELKDPKIVKFAKTVWAKEVVKAYPKVYAKLQRAQKALLDKELAEARQTLRDNLNKLLSRSSIYKRISSRTTERKVDKASADAINDMREEIKALGGVDALSDAELISLTKITEDFYKEGKANQQQIKNELKSAKKAVSESARDAITNQGEKTSVELQSAESALDFLLQSEGKNSNQVVMTTEQGVIVFESADDFLNYAFTEKTNKDGTKETVPSDPRATYGGIVTTPNPNVLEQRETKIGKMYRSSLGGGLIYLIDKLKGKNPSQATIDFFNGIEKAIFDGTTNQRKTNFKFRSARRQYIAKIFRPKGIAPGVLSKSRAEVRYSMYMMSTPSINGEPLVLTDENGVKLEGVSIGEVMYLYQLMKDPHFLTGDRKIGLSKKSMFDIIDFMNSSEGKLGKEVIEEDQISFKELADKASIILEANGISSDNIKPKKLNLDNYKDSPLVAEILGKIYGKNIPENIEYFPSSVESSETEQVPDVDALIDNSPDVNAVTAMAGFFIDRQPGGKVRIQNYGSQVLRYYSGMSNTIAKLPVLKLLQATFDKANKNLIGEYYGSSFLGEMKENIYRYVTMSQGKEWDIGLMKGAFGKYFTLGLGVQMFFNLGSAISQLASAPGPIIAYGIRNYVKGLALLWKNKNSFKTYYKGLWDSPLLQERFGSRLEMSSVFANIPTGERGVKETMNVVNKAIISLGILPTSFADAMSVMASLPIYVNEYEKNLETMNSEDAKTNAENETMLLAEKFLQTRREELMSSDEAKFRNTLYAFATIVPQMHRQALMAFKRMQRGEGDFSTNMSVFIWSSVGSQILFRSIRPVAEALFQGGDDEEERAKLKGDKRLRKAAVDIVSDATKSLSVTGAFLSVLVKTLYQFIDAEDDRSIVIKMADISPELIEAIPALSIKVRGLRDVAFSIQDEEQLKALTQGLQVLTNFPSEKIRMAAVQMSDGFTSDYINGMDAVLRLSGLISEDKAKEKIFAQMMAGEAAAISELSPAEIGKYTKRRKDEYNVIVSRLAKDYATATTDSQRNLATEKLFALVGGTTKYTDFDELSEQLFNRFDEKILEYSLPEDVLKVKKMPNVEKINFVAKEAMLKMKTDPQEAISYIQQLQVLGAIEGKEEEKIYEIIMRTPQ